MPMMWWVFFFSVWAGSIDVALAQRPDPVHTPGAFSASLTKADICKKGYSTKSVRPPEVYTDALKKKQIGEYGYKDTRPATYEEDHLIPLEIGGNPTNPLNLWPERWIGKCGAHVKDRLENKLHKLVCAGRLDLHEAQQEIAADWVKAYNRYVGRLDCNAQR
jgi:hypothetical protein